MVKLAAHNGSDLGSNPSGSTINNTRRAARMAQVDALSPDLRALVHEYGFPTVKSLLDLGVKKPRQIKHVVETILDEFSPTRGSYSKQK